MLRFFADDVLISLIYIQLISELTFLKFKTIPPTFRMHSNASISKHGFRSGSGDFDTFSSAIDLVTEVREYTKLDFLLVYR